MCDPDVDDIDTDTPRCPRCDARPHRCRGAVNGVCELEMYPGGAS